MTRSIAVLGAGPALGRSVAQRYANEGYEVAVVARDERRLRTLADELERSGTRAYAIPADLSDTDAVPRLADQVRAAVGDPEVLYYGAAADGFVPALDLTPEGARAMVPLGITTPVALVRAFLPAMLAGGRGAVMTVQGASALQGLPHIAGGFALAAQRNYLQAVRAAVADRGVYVGALYVGAVIEGSAYHAWHAGAKAAGEAVEDLPYVSPDELADRIWTMHRTGGPAEAVYPER